VTGARARRWRSGWRRSDRYDVVLLLIVACYAITVSMPSAGWVPWVMLVQIATVWMTFLVSESLHAVRLAAAVLAVIGVVAVAAHLAGLSERDEAVAAYFVTGALLFVVAPAVIVRHVFGRATIDRQTLLGAIAAYLLIGMSFSFAYAAVSAAQPAPPFFGAAGRGSMADMLFFSFVTLTTTGYGNLTPVANPGQSLSVLEAIVGQLFLVTAVARIVAGWTPGWARRAAKPPAGRPAPPA
jgi:hypothetical protein